MPTKSRREAIHIDESPRGRGVFASRNFAEGEIVELCPTLEIEADAVAGRLDDYVFSTGDDESTVVLILGYGMLYNHSAEPNVQHVQWDDDNIGFEALRAIKRGEELTIDYGEQWWSDRGEEPI